jgi:ankyrin repeat protein
MTKRPSKKLLLISFICVLLFIGIYIYVYVNGENLLSHAAYYGNVKTMRFLIMAGADMNGGGSQTDVPLVNASRNGQINAVKFLLDKGANPDITQKIGETPLMSATRNGYTEIVQLLLSKGADIYIIGEDGTALDIANQKGHSDIVSLLIQAKEKK